ncbi:MAG: LirA/MavJ family T4SS effector [Pseudomonadota bacterium]
MCVFNGCANPNHPNSANWGVGSICQQHFDAISTEVQGQTTCDQGYADDYARIWVLMMERNRMLNYLDNTFGTYLVNHDPAAFTVNLPSVDYQPHVHEALVHFERRCWFSGQHIVPLGILTAADFFGFIAQGYVLDDFGAGYTHGAYTHRLQWFCIMHAITNGFTTANPATTGWNHSAYELYTKAAEPGLRNPVRLTTGTLNESGSSLWAVLFDLGGRGAYFNHPDELHHEIRFGTTQGTGIEIAITQHQREWGVRVWSLTRQAAIGQEFAQLANAEQNLSATQRAKRALHISQAPSRQDLINRARTKVDTDPGYAASRNALIAGTSPAVASGGVAAQKEMEMASSGAWKRARAGVLIPQADTLSMSAASVNGRKTYSRVALQ